MMDMCCIDQLAMQHLLHAAIIIADGKDLIHEYVA